MPLIVFTRRGAPNAHGSFDFEVKYEITDPSSDGLPSVTEQWDRNYTFNVTAVTDQTETTITEISADKTSVVVNGDEVTITENLALSVKITIDQSDDPNAGDQPDYDGSEN